MGTALDRVLLAASALEKPSMFAAQKVSGAQAHYRHTESWNRRCGNCCFVNPGADGKNYCRRVEVQVDIGDGQSDPGSTCDLWGPANGVAPLSAVLQAAASLNEPAALAPVGDDEAHEHLLAACPWYKAVCSGQSAHTPDKHCKDLSVSLTPRTPEASTVPQPTVPPGGPGLFHVKGMELPPYVQHLYKHLVARYGKHDAYRVAVGVVKKWASGVNPGGWKTKSGKGKKTHPDVQAAAQRNVAEWEEDRAKGHEQSAGHASTTHDDQGAVALAFVRPYRRTEHGRPQVVRGHTARTPPYTGAAERQARQAETGSQVTLAQGRELARSGDRQRFKDWAAKMYPGKTSSELETLYNWLSSTPAALSNVLELAVVAGVPGPPQSSMLPGATAPGARPIYNGQLKQQPMQTVAASPPLPPGVTPPTSKEFLDLEKAILALPQRTSMLTGAAMQAHAGAHKVKTGDLMGGLHMLRAAQSGLYSHAQKVVGESIPLANVFSAANPPAAASTIQAHWQEASRKRNDVRAVSQQCAHMIDRIRRYHFHGRYGSIAQQTRWL